MKIVQFETRFILGEHRIELFGFANPDVLLARLARHFLNPVLPQNVMDESRAIHPALRWIRGTIRVSEIARGELERGFDQLFDACRLCFKLEKIAR